jgi:CheY-like chemotaxis protein
MLVVGLLKSEERFRLNPQEIIKVHSFFYICHYTTALSINLNNHLKGIDTSLMPNDSVISAGDKRRILIVDDDPDISNLYKLSLERDGFVVDTFNDPLLALSDYKVGTYGLLLIDIKMPRMNGFELYQKLKNMGDKPKICFITAFEEFNNQFRELFPDLKEKVSFLIKPIELQYLTRVVKSELGYS